MFQRNMHRRGHKHKRSYAYSFVLVATKGRVILQQVVDMPALHLSESSL